MKIKAGDRVFLETFWHDVYETDVEKGDEVYDLKAILIEKENLEQAGNAVGNTTRKWIEEDYPYARGYFFENEEGNNIGSCWIMYKGGDEKLYRIRDHDSFIFRVQVDEGYQGLGYGKQIMKMIFGIIADEGCRNTCLVCAVKNEKAGHLYRSLGMKKAERKLFIRMFGKNIPYYSL